MRLLVLASLASLVACADKSDDTGADSGSSTVDTSDSSDTSDTGEAPVDADGDGFVAGEDCDDANAETYPGAVETCNQLDDDCDGTRDEDDAVDAPTWYADADRDGAGDDSATTRSCLQPPDSAAVGGDCDDTDAAYHPGADESDCTDPNDYNCDGSVGYADADGDGVAACEDCDDATATTFPGAEEVCNEVDDDCDAEVDETGATGELTWYADADVDGFGAAATTLLACESVAPEGYVLDASDCDDADAMTNPAALEVCGGADEDCDGATDEDDASDASMWYADTDADGFGSAASARSACLVPMGFLADATDCDDTAALTNPAGTEVCGGADEDCDGTTDEDDASDAPTWFADTDADGFGNATSSTRACLVPTGFVADATDCGDGDALVNPAGTEVCGGVDEDCDGTTDEDDASDAPTWFMDADADGFGDATMTDIACVAPAMYVADATDCDDVHAAAFPGGIETCDGALDENCDGAVDEGSAIDAPTWYADTDADGYGALATAVNACQVPANHVADATDCDDAAAGTNPAADEVCAGGDEDCDGVANEGDAIDATAWYPDADGDGYGGNTYVSYLCYTPVGQVTNRLDCDDSAAGTNPGAPEVCGGADEDCDGATDEAGAVGETAWYADADGDGFLAGTSTLACSAEGGSTTAPTEADCDDSSDASYPGATEVCGDLSDNDCSPSIDCHPVVGSNLLTDNPVTLAGLLAADRLGNAITMGDLSGDGVDDLVIGGNGIDAGSTNLGQVYVWYGPIAPTTSLALTATTGARTPDLTITGSETSMNLASTAVDIVPDIDGDGMNELLVGAFEQNQSSPAITDPGYAYLFKNVSGASTATTATATGFVQGSAVSDYVGWALASAGDVDGDGNGDFIVGGHQIGGSDAGRAGVFSGEAFGTGGRAMPSTAGAGYTIFTGTAANDYAGYAVDGAGDIDGDGFDDVLIGAPNSNSSTAPTSYVMVQYGGEAFFGAAVTAAGGTGSTAADTVLTAGASGDRLGISVAGLGDVTGDGYDDFGASADYADWVGTLNKGRVYVVAGSGAHVAGGAIGTVAIAQFVGEAADDYFGRTVQSAGDVNGDGVNDMWVGATAADLGSTAGVGAAYLYYGPLDPTVGSGAFAIVRGTVTSDALGGRIAPGADLDRDGYDESLLGVPAWDTSLSVQNNGGIFLIFGNGE